MIQKIYSIIKVLLITICFGIILHQPQKEFELTFLDVGQGDGIYISDGENSNFFIDGGSSDEKEVGERRILPFLKSNAIRKIDYWFVTHADSDHISGLLEVLESGYSIDYLVMPKAIPKDENYEKLILATKKNKTNIVYMETGNYIKTESLELKCLYPQNVEITDKNESSLVLELTKGEFRALFTGDISSEAENKMLQEGVLSDISLYKTAHHGSKFSSSAEFLEKLSPEVAVVSCGENNRYGHPHKETLERLNDVGSIVMSTVDYGAITITLDGAEMKVEGYLKMPTREEVYLEHFGKMDDDKLQT